MTPTFLVLRPCNMSVQPLLKCVRHCHWRHEWSEKNLREKQICFQHSSVVSTRWVPYQSGCAPEKGRIIKMSLPSGLPDPQMASFVLHPSLVTFTPVGQKIRLTSFGSCFPLRWHMLCYIAFYSLFHIKMFKNTYALIYIFICWKYIMAASYWWKSLPTGTKPNLQF